MQNYHIIKSHQLHILEPKFGKINITTYNNLNDMLLK